MSDPGSDRRSPRESVVEGRDTKRVRTNVLNGEESDGEPRATLAGCEG